MKKFIPLAALVGILFLTLQPQSGKDLVFYYQQGMAAYEKKDFASYLDYFRKARQIAPNHPEILYHLARAYALTNNGQEALELLEKVIAMDLKPDAGDDPDFSSLKNSPQFKKLKERMEKIGQPIIRSSPAFRIPNKGLLIEGIAHDPVGDTFFLSSVHSRKIIAVKKDGSISDFITEKQDGVLGILGMAVDSKRESLWACTTACPQIKDFGKEETDQTVLSEFDLKSGRLKKKYLPPKIEGQQNLNDITLNSQGIPFVSDAFASCVYTVNPKNDRLEIFLKEKKWQNLQGLAFSPDSSILFIADYSQGIFRIDMATKKIALLPAPAHTTLLGIDGLCIFKKSLIVIQNGIQPNRVVRLNLDPDLTSIEKSEILEMNNPLFYEPTLGTIAGDIFYFNANSQWPLFHDDGSIETEKLQEPLILKIALKS